MTKPRQADAAWIGRAESSGASSDLRATAVMLALIDADETGSRRLVADGGEKHVHGAERFIQKHFSTIRSLREVARHVGVGHDHLRHLFKSRRERSLVRYLDDVRVACAKLLLTRSSLPLKQIADACGFRDVYYFSNVFRRLAMVPPGLYRQSVRTP